VNVSDRERLIAIVERYYRPVGHKFAGGKQYGCLAMRGQTATPPPAIQAIPFGVIPPESRCSVFAPEKVARLAERPQDMTSYQSRNPDENKWGGAIRLPDSSLLIGVLAWSSYPELVDEGFMAAASVKAQLADIRWAERVTSYGRPRVNEFLYPILDMML
jgi:hypothetical protein